MRFEIGPDGGIASGLRELGPDGGIEAGMTEEPAACAPARACSQFAGEGP